MPSPRQAGFTLIEVLVALAILSVAVVASIQGFAQGLRLLKLSGDHQQAMLLADEKIREVVEFKEGNDAGVEGRMRWERTLRSLETPDLVPAAGGIPTGRVYQLDVRVSWDAQRHVEIRTLRMVPTEVSEVTVPTSSGTGPGKQGTASGAQGTSSGAQGTSLFGPRPGATPPSGATSPGKGLLPSLGGRPR